MSEHRPRRRTGLLVGLALLVVAVVAGVGYAVWPRATGLERAAGLLPPDTLRVTWTNWAGLREELGAESVDGEAGERFYDAVADRDLSTSSLASSTDLLVQGLGLNPMASDWEMLGQSRDGMVLVMQLAEGTDVEALADRFGRLGFDEPGSDELSGAVWRGGPDVISDVPGLATYELQNVAFLADERLLVASEDADHLESVVPVVRGDEDGLDASAVLEHVDTPLTAVALLEDYACEALSMSSADPEAQAQAEALVEEAGGVTAMTGYLVALGEGERLTIVLDFEDEARAEDNAVAREALAGAEDPAQFVAYPEVFTLSEVSQEGTSVVMTGTAHPEFAPLSNLTEGPVLLATC